MSTPCRYIVLSKKCLRQTEYMFCGTAFGEYLENIWEWFMISIDIKICSAYNNSSRKSVLFQWANTKIWYACQSCDWPLADNTKIRYFYRYFTGRWQTTLKLATKREYIVQWCYYSLFPYLLFMIFQENLCICSLTVILYGGFPNYLWSLQKKTHVKEFWIVRSNINKTFCIRSCLSFSEKDRIIPFGL